MTPVSVTLALTMFFEWRISISRVSTGEREEEAGYKGWGIKYVR